MSFAAFAALLPAAATATSNAKLISEAKVSMRVETKAEEKQHLIPYKQSTVFIVRCSVKRGHVLCREHSGPQRCVNGKPWTQLSDIYPVIKGHVGLSLFGGAGHFERLLPQGRLSLYCGQGAALAKRRRARHSPGPS